MVVVNLKIYIIMTAEGFTIISLILKKLQARSYSATHIYYSRGISALKKRSITD